MVSVLGSMDNPMVYVRNRPDDGGGGGGGGPGGGGAEIPPPSQMLPFPFQPGMQLTPMYFTQMATFDGKRMRRPVQRKTVDYNAPVFQYIENRLYNKSMHGTRVLQPHAAYYIDMLPPMGLLDNPVNAVTTRFVRMSTNKFKCPIHIVRFLRDGKRLVSGASSGEFTLWSGHNFNFETNIQAHDTALRVMEWNKNETWLLTADHTGTVKYWQSNMNNVKTFDAHTEVIRDASFSPTDKKFVTCSDDSLVKIWDFYSCTEERAMRGHGAEVKCCDWHPQKGLIVSGSKDTQQPIKLWDPRVGQSLTTLHLHKATVTRAKWNRNGNWLLTSSRDHLLKIFDIRAMKEMQVFRGHKKEVMSISWHPIHEGMFASGGADGSILFWIVGTDREVGGMDTAHEAMVLSLDWHPLGHVLASGSNDHTAKFWTRNRPGDKMTDKYNLNTNPNEGIVYDEIEDPLGLQVHEPVIIDEKVIPGMGEINELDIEDSVINALAPSKIISKSNEKTAAKSLHQLLPNIRGEVVPGLQISTEKIKEELEAAAMEQLYAHQMKQQEEAAAKAAAAAAESGDTQLTNYNTNDDYGYDGTEQGEYQGYNSQRDYHKQPPPPGSEASEDGYYNKSRGTRGNHGRHPSNEGGRRRSESGYNEEDGGSWRGNRGSFRGRGRSDTRPYPDSRGSRGNWRTRARGRSSDRSRGYNSDRSRGYAGNRGGSDRSRGGMDRSRGRGRSRRGSSDNFRGGSSDNFRGGSSDNFRGGSSDNFRGGNSDNFRGGNSDYRSRGRSS